MAGAEHDKSGEMYRLQNVLCDDVSGMHQGMHQTHEVSWGKIHRPWQWLIAGDVSILQLVVIALHRR